jgi:ferredoxin
MGIKIIPTFYVKQLRLQHQIIERSQCRINQLCAQLDFALIDENEERIKEIKAQITEQAKIKMKAEEKAEQIASRAE